MSTNKNNRETCEVSAAVFKDYATRLRYYADKFSHIAEMVDKNHGKLTVLSWSSFELGVNNIRTALMKFAIALDDAALGVRIPNADRIVTLDEEVNQQIDQITNQISDKIKRPRKQGKSQTEGQ